MSQNLNPGELMICFCGGLVRIPKVGELLLDTQELADILQVSPRRVRQLCEDEGLPRSARGEFYLPDVMNFLKVQQIAEELGKRPQDLKGLHYVDFTLNQDGPLISMKIPTAADVSHILKGRNRGA